MQLVTTKRKSFRPGTVWICSDCGAKKGTPKGLCSPVEVSDNTLSVKAHG